MVHLKCVMMPHHLDLPGRLASLQCYGPAAQDVVVAAAGSSTDAADAAAGPPVSMCWFCFSLQQDWGSGHQVRKCAVAMLSM
jgi:hypothetical protein